MIFSWDEDKNRTNRIKHGVSFQTAKHVFDDPLHLTRQDRVENNEVRWQTLGLIQGVIVLMVAHTVQDDDLDEKIRIISAREASKQERKSYEQGTF